MTDTDTPEPTIEDWTSLYAAALDFRALAPWKWLADTDIFGVRNPDTGEIGWCSVFGAGGQVYGLMVHRGTRGLLVHHGMATGQIDVEDARYVQDGWLASFENRSALERGDLAIVERLGLALRGRKAWPMFRRYEPGFLPWPLTGDAAAFLTVALQQASDVATRFRDDPEAVGPDDPGRFLVRVSRSGPAGAIWSDQRLAPPPPVRDASASIDELRVRRLSRSLQRSTVHWECDYYHSPAIIAERGRRPYFASLFLLVDRRSGMIVHMELGKPPLSAEVLCTQFLDALEKLGTVPGTVVVKRGLVHDALAPLADGLGFAVQLERALPALDEARAALAAHVSGRT